ncbi:MAG: sulfotransferase, partial [Actinomycetota bacterium]
MSREGGGGPVFIVGAPRSGTSILYRTLLKHSSFAVEGDEALQLAESAVLDSMHTAPRWKPPRPPRLWLFFLRDADAYRAFLDEVARHTAGHEP